MNTETRIQIGQYILGKNLGIGAFGKGEPVRVALACLGLGEVEYSVEYSAIDTRPVVPGRF